MGKSLLRASVGGGGGAKKTQSAAAQRAEIADMYARVIKLSTENKINSKNTWSLNLIEHMDTIIEEDCAAKQRKRKSAKRNQAKDEVEAEEEEEEGRAVVGKEAHDDQDANAGDDEEEEEDDDDDGDDDDDDGGSDDDARQRPYTDNNSHKQAEEEEEDSPTDLFNFQKASCTLDASVKIYSYRVDDTWSSSYRILENLSRSRANNNGGRDEDSNNNADGENDDGDEEGDNDEYDGSGTRRRKRGHGNNSTRKASAQTLEKNVANLNITHPEREFDIDPKFNEMVRELEGEHMFTRAALFSDGPDHKQQQQQQKLEEHLAGDATLASACALPDMEELFLRVSEAEEAMGFVVSEAALCPFLETYRQQVLGDRDVLAGFPVTATPRKQRPRAPVFTPHSAGGTQELGSGEHKDHNKNHRVADGEDDGGFVMDGAADFYDYDGDNDADLGDVPAVGDPNMECSNAGSVMVGDALPADEFDFETIIPPPPPSSSTNAEGGDDLDDADGNDAANKPKNAKKTRVAKERFLIDFRSPFPDEALLAPPVQQPESAATHPSSRKTKKAASRPQDPLLLTNAVMTRRQRMRENGDFLLDPSEVSLREEGLCDMFLPAHERTTPASHSMDDNHDGLGQEPSGTNGKELQVGDWQDLDHARLPVAPLRQPSLLQYDDDGAVMFDYGDDYDDGDVGGADGPEEDGAQQEANTGLAAADDAAASVGRGLGYSTDGLLKAGRTVQKINIRYDTVAKQVDVRRMKKDMWREVRTNLRTHPVCGQQKADSSVPMLSEERENAPENVPIAAEREMQEEGAAEEEPKEVSFQNLVHDLADNETQQGISVPLYFICLLHLANEKNLKLESDRLPGSSADVAHDVDQRDLGNFRISSNVGL